MVWNECDGISRVRVFPYFSSTLIALQLELRSCDCQQLGFDFSFHHFSGLFAKYPSRCIGGYLSNQGQNQSSIFPVLGIAWSFYDKRIVVSTDTRLDRSLAQRAVNFWLKGHQCWLAIQERRWFLTKYEIGKKNSQQWRASSKCWLERTVEPAHVGCRPADKLKKTQNQR